ncbi:MAG: serine hydrolase [Acidobacteriota bacterium]
MLRPLLSIGGILFATACAATAPPASKPLSEVPKPALPEVSAAIGSALAGAKGTTAVSFYDLATGETAGREEHRRFHAASTMKVPVLVELFRAIDRGEMALDRPVPVKNEFKSLVDGSPFSLNQEEDGDPDLYAAVGESRALGELARRMIQRSSNLSTNLLIELLGAKRVTAAMRELGASEIEVLRGVEDQKAFDAGLINSTTAYDLQVILRAIAEKKAVSGAASAAMIEILEGQEFKEKIPAGLPPGTRVANKTGDITGIHHDAAIIFPPGPPGRAPYVLVVLTEGYPSEEEADASIGAVSKAVWQAVQAGASSR